MQKLLTCLRYLLLLPLALFAQWALSQQIELSQQSWSAEVIRDRGQPVIPLFDGWYPNADGSRTLCFGFFNMNREQTLSIPHGENNYLSDDRFAAMLPTHFDPLPPRYRHVFCAFSVTVDDSFTREDKIYWHLSSNGQQLKVPGHTLPAYVLDEPVSDGRGDIAPIVNVGNQSAQGRTGLLVGNSIKTRVGAATALSATISHPAEEVWVGWAKHSGPGTVNFSQKEYTITPGSETEIEVTFDAPGDYIVRMQTIDDIAAFEFYCCHSNAYFQINVSE